MTKLIKATSRRGALKTLAGAAAGAASLPLWARYAQAQRSEPIKIGFQSTAPGSAPPMAAGTGAPPRRR
jgi:hypothetical protein